jgi:hypothetical protein
MGRICSPIPTRTPRLVSEPPRNGDRARAAWLSTCCGYPVALKWSSTRRPPPSRSTTNESDDRRLAQFCTLRRAQAGFARFRPRRANARYPRPGNCASFYASSKEAAPSRLPDIDRSERLDCAVGTVGFAAKRSSAAGTGGRVLRRRSESAARPPSGDERSRQADSIAGACLCPRGQPATAASGASWLVRWTSGSLAVVGCPPRWNAVICRAAAAVGLCLRVLCAAGGWWRCWPAGCAPCCWSQRAQPGRVRGWRHHKRPRALGSFGRVAGSGCSARGCRFRWNGRILGVLRSRWL